MVTITLTNNNPDSEDSSIIIDLNTNLCTFSDGRTLNRKQLLQQDDFTHPLLATSFTPEKANHYHYEYDDSQGLFNSAVFVYTVLLHADSPQQCTFKINPSKSFQPYKRIDDLYFSIDNNKCAKDTISIEQFNSIVSSIARIKFQFSEDLEINDTFTFADLPLSIDGDRLFTSQDYLYDILDNPGDLSRVELRYINPKMGFGVYCREKIKADEIIGVYTGIKTNQRPDSLNFSFKPAQDSLNMHVDAKFHGNITRFINHAPGHEVTASSDTLAANILGAIYYFNGISLIVFVTKREIIPGEQLLVDYGNAYFINGAAERFKRKKSLLDSFNIFSVKRTNQIRIMAKHGVQKAQTYLNWRSVCIFSTIFIIISGLQLIFH